MGEFEKSCVNCGVLNCAKRDKEYPEFCLTTNFDVKELEEFLKNSHDYKIDANRRHGQEIIPHPHAEYAQQNPDQRCD